MEQDKTNGHMGNGAAMARKPVTSIAEHRPNKERSPLQRKSWQVLWVCGPWKNWDIFSFQGLPGATWGGAFFMLKHEVMNVTTMGLAVSLCILVASDRCPWLMPDRTITPPPTWGTLFTMLTSANHSSTNLCPKFERNMLFVHMENVWDLLFQLMGPIFTCCVYIFVQCICPNNDIISPWNALYLTITVSVVSQMLISRIAVIAGVVNKSRLEHTVV